MVLNFHRSKSSGRRYSAKYVLILAGLLIPHGHLFAAGPAIGGDSRACVPSPNFSSTNQSLDLNHAVPPLSLPAGESPFVIHYGLNDSHSRSWVQHNPAGVVGITYFQRFEGSADDGTLMYKTILPDGSENAVPITTGKRLEKSVLLYDSLMMPHVFVAHSTDADQIIDHYSMDNAGEWQCDTIIHFYNQGGKFIYELSADTGPDHSFHLLILKTRSNVDSDDFMDAWINSYLYHLTNATGYWVNELVHNYDMPYTYDMYIKSSIRQDIKVDRDGYVHVAFGEQISTPYDPSRLFYATNKSGAWQIETALNNDYGLVDDAGWFPSLCLDNDGVPHIACVYFNRVLTHSATYCKLLLLKRLGANDWKSEVVAEYDDGYYGRDGRRYTGALCHLVFDGENRPHIVFSDISSSHWDYQRLNVGNIRYGVYADGVWDITTVYRQPLPSGYYNAVEMLGECLVVLDERNMIRVIGQEMEVTGEGQYTCRLVELARPIDPTHVVETNESEVAGSACVAQNHPNPFNSGTRIEFDLPRESGVTVTIYNLLGRQVDILLNGVLPAGKHAINWSGTDCDGKVMPSGVYFFRLEAGEFMQTKKMLLLR